MTDGEAVVAGDAWCDVDDYGGVGDARVEPLLPACPPPVNYTRRSYSLKRPRNGRMLWNGLGNVV
nr:hypothetical protein Iba_chr08eCG6510 [Ipomoea batatas]